MNKKKIFLIVGRSCVGKTSISKEVCKRLGLAQVKSYTTRERRVNETEENSDHYFIEKSDVELYRDDIAAYTEINGNSYFVTKKVLIESDVYVIDPNGVADLKERYADDFDYVTIYIRVPGQLAKSRAVTRQDDLYSERIKAESEQFDLFEKSMGWDYHILNNGEFKDAVLTMEKMIRKELNL